MLINNNFLNVNVFESKEKDTTLIFTHGLGEYSKSYEETALFFNKQGYNVFTYDLRGHGKSEGERGSIDSYKTFLDDLNELVVLAYQQTSKVYLIGHSMGGIITNLYAALNNNIDGVIITASPTTYMKDLKNLRFLPKLLINNKKIKTNFKDPKLTHNNDYVVDAYDIRYFRFKLANEVLLKGMKQLIKNYKNFNSDLLLIYSEKDLLAPVYYGKHFYDVVNSKNKELFILKESFHNVFIDIEKDLIHDKILSWIEER